MTTYIENKTFNEISIGDSAKIYRTLKEEDIALFAAMSGDVNPSHVDPKFARSDLFHQVIAHGMWVGALLSTVLGTELPGPGTLYLDQSLHFKHPVMVGDTLTIQVTVTKKKKTQHVVELDCLCTNQNEHTILTGTAIVIAPTTKIKREKIPTKKVIMKNPEGKWYRQLFKRTQGKPPLVTAVVHPVDEVSLRGAIASAEAHIIQPILVGPENKIRTVAEKCALDISAYQLIPTQHSEAAAEKAVALIHAGQAECLMKGKIHTDEFMHPILNKHSGLRTNRRMSHIFALEVPYYPKPLFITDAALHIFPTLEDKVDIVQNAIDLFVALNLGTPKVAIVSAVETVNKKIPSTLDATALCKMAERNQIQGGILDGPLSFDLAISKESAQVKGLASPVAGEADIIVVPDVESGNMLYKQMTYLSKIEAAGIVLGASVPIILTSRDNNILSRKASCAMALLYAHHKKNAFSHE